LEDGRDHIKGVQSRFERWKQHIYWY
jgi:hypothetical protein